MLWKKLFLGLVFILPFSFALGPAEGIDLQLTRALVPLLFLLWLGENLLRRKIVVDSKVRFWLLLSFLLISVLSFFWASDEARAVRKILYLFSLVPVYLTAHDFFSDPDYNFSTAWFLKVVSWSVLVLSLVGLAIFSLQWSIGLDPTLILLRKYWAPMFLGEAFSEVVLAFPSWLVNLSGRTVMRTFGSFPDPHLFALYLNLTLPLVIWAYYRFRKSFYLMIASLALIASLLSFSRAAYFSILVAGVFWLFQKETLRFLLQKQVWLVLAGLAGVLFFALPNPLWGRLLSSFNLSEGSNSGRLEMWRAGAQATYEHPWGGVGIGNFANYVDPEANLRSPIYAHNLFLDFGAETGFANALVLLALVLAPVGAVVFRSNQASIPERLVATSAVIFLVHSLFETPIYSVRVFPLFLVILAISFRPKTSIS